MTATARTPAKINLALKVGPLRPDGFHSLATVYQAVSLYDEVRAHPAARGQFTVAVTGEGAGVVPLDDGNLAIRAAKLLAKKYGVTEGVDLHINKTIAVAGGLAGGSTDAAGALVACNELWGVGASREDLLGFAALLGSDVPFCLVGGNAIGTGRGEITSPVLARGSYEWVLAYSDRGLSTPSVFATFEELSGDVVDEPEVPADLMTALRSGDPYQVGQCLTNDLAESAIRLCPSINQTLEVGEECGALGAIVSGSGPTCIFLAGDDAHAIDIAVALASSGTCRTVQRATGPVGGARLITG